MYPELAVNSVGLNELLFEAKLLFDWRNVPGVVLCIVLPQCDLVKCDMCDALEEDVELDLKVFKNKFKVSAYLL